MPAVTSRSAEIHSVQLQLHSPLISFHASAHFLYSLLFVGDFAGDEVPNHPVSSLDSVFEISFEMSF